MHDTHQDRQIHCSATNFYVGTAEWGPHKFHDAVQGEPFRHPSLHPPDPYQLLQ